MKDFEELKRECLEEVMAAGIKPGFIISWEINTRAIRRWGLCTKTPDNRFKIQISSRLLTDDSISINSCKETIIHEILHTCNDSMKHTGNWKRNANIMNLRYGYNIKRCTSGDEKGIESEPVKKREIKYIYKCKKCGQVIQRTRECKFTKYYKKYGCGICGTKKAFIPIK